MTNSRLLLAALACFGLAFAASREGARKPEKTAPPGKPTPAPEKPKEPRRPRWEAVGASVEAEEAGDTVPAVGKPSLGGQVGPDGEEVQIDLPLGQRMRNIGSHRDGAGMCVSTSMTHAARWHNLRGWKEWRDWCAQFPGGGNPYKMDRQIKQFAQEKSVPVPPYLQYQGRDMAVLEQALKNGILPSVTYSGRDGVRYRGPISHMVNLVYLGPKSAAIMDNNGRPEDLIWMSRGEFFDRWAGRGSGWAHFWLLPGPPPPPRRS